MSEGNVKAPHGEQETGGRAANATHGAKHAVWQVRTHEPHKPATPVKSPRSDTVAQRAISTSTAASGQAGQAQHREALGWAPRWVGWVRRPEGRPASISQNPTQCQCQPLPAPLASSPMGATMSASPSSANRAAKSSKKPGGRAATPPLVLALDGPPLPPKPEAAAEAAAAADLGLHWRWCVCFAG